MNRHKIPFIRTVFCVVVLLNILNHGLLYAQNRIKITEPNWNQLLANERKTLSDEFVVEVISSGSVGSIIDAQMINASSQGSNAGSQLGAAYGRATYLDHAFQKNSVDYSAKKDVTSTLVGSLIGGVLADSAPQPRFITRYTLKTLDGGIRYFEEVKESGFRQSVGLCVSTIDISPVDQGLCVQTTEQIRSLYLAKVAPIYDRQKDENQNCQKAGGQTVSQSKKTNGKEAGKVRCKFGTSTPVMLDREICIQAQGEILNDQ